jgi:hypothetical protein
LESLPGKVEEKRRKEEKGRVGGPLCPFAPFPLFITGRAEGNVLTF